MPYQAFIIDGVRTPTGKNKGSLSHYHPADLGAITVDALMRRQQPQLPPSAVDDVIFGCLSQAGAQAFNIARTIVLSSEVLPQSVPGVTVDRQAGSSQQAIHFAAQAVMSGAQDIVIAGGVEVMSMVPLFAQLPQYSGSNKPAYTHPWCGEMYTKKYGEKHKSSMQKWGTPLVPSPPGIPSQFVGAELVAEKYHITREELDQFAVSSHVKAIQATKAGHFKNEIIPVQGRRKKEKTGDGEKNDEVHFTMSIDEGMREGTNVERLAKLKPLLSNGGKITAGTASQVSDGAAAVLIVNERALQKYPNLQPMARIVALEMGASDPVIMLEGPVFAGGKALLRANLTLKDMDLYEVSEAFASPPLAFVKALGGDMEKLNVNGGAIALGHPLGATGAKLMTTLVHELKRRNKRYGLLSICEGGGLANATIVENLAAVQRSSKL